MQDKRVKIISGATMAPSVVLINQCAFHIIFHSSEAYSNRLMTILYSSSKIRYSFSSISLRCSSDGSPLPFVYVLLSPVFFNARSIFISSFCFLLNGIFSLFFTSILYARYSSASATFVACNRRISYTMRACFCEQNIYKIERKEKNK